jgi:hypothetical protein
MLIMVIMTDADGSYAIGSVIQENAEIVLISRTACARLPTAKPALRSEVLEEWVRPPSPIVVSYFRREGASDRFGPAFIIEEASVISSLLQPAGWVALVGYDGAAFGDVEVPCSKCAYAEP